MDRAYRALLIPSSRAIYKVLATGTTKARLASRCFHARWSRRRAIAWQTRGDARGRLPSAKRRPRILERLIVPPSRMKTIARLLEPVFGRIINAL